jgi:hypothetical protein
MLDAERVQRLGTGHRNRGGRWGTGVHDPARSFGEKKP